ncbi:MAG: ABC transporter substrate-binding protein [Terriglobales bacterium]
MKQCKWLLGLSLGVFFATLTLVGCQSSQPKSIKIVHLAPLTGSASSYGSFGVNAAKMAVEEINSKGGVKLPDGSQLKIEYTEVDETSNSAGAIEGTKKAISLDPLVILGPNRSGGVMAAEKLWKDAKIPALTDATSAQTTRLGNPYTFRMQISSEYWIPLLVKTGVEKYNVKRPAVIYGLNDYSKANWVATEPAMAKFNLKPVIVQTFNDNDQDFSAQLLAIKKSGADSIFLYGYTPEVGKITRQRSELGMKNIPIFSERAASVPSVFDLAGKENYEGMVTTTTMSQGDPDPKIQEFIKKYDAKYHQAFSASHVIHYDSVYIVADLVSKVGLDREKIRQELAKLDYQGTMGHYVADKEGNLVHHMRTQVWKDNQWVMLMSENYPVER